MTTTTTETQTRLANLLLRMRGQAHDHQGLGHAEPYGDSEAAWDDAGDLMDEAQMEHETAEDDAAEAAGVDVCAATYANTQLEGEALFRAALALKIANEAGRLARVDSLKAEAQAAARLWTAEAAKTRKGLRAAREALR